MTGLRPIVELYMSEFMLVAFDQVINEAPRLRYMSGGQVKVPMVFKAGFGFAAVDAVLELEEAFFAVGIDVIGDRGAAERNGFAENFLQGREKLGELIAGYGGGAAAGTDSGAEQRFVGINVADAAKQFLI